MAYVPLSSRYRIFQSAPFFFFCFLAQNLMSIHCTSHPCGERLLLPNCRRCRPPSGCPRLRYEHLYLFQGWLMSTVIHLPYTIGQDHSFNVIPKKKTCVPMLFAWKMEDDRVCPFWPHSFPASHLALKQVHFSIVQVGAGQNKVK